VTLTNGSDFSIIIEKMSWAHSQWSVTCVHLYVQPHCLQHPPSC
jgi:hypothetical protein